jgi:hypothetical protein
MEMGTISDVKAVKWIGRLMFAPLLLAITSLLACTLVAWYEVGHFPAFNDPDPTALNLPILSNLAALLILWWFVPLLLSLSATPFLLIVSLQRKTALRDFAILLFVQAVWLWFIVADPLGLGTWIVD